MPRYVVHRTVLRKFHEEWIVETDDKDSISGEHVEAEGDFVHEEDQGIEEVVEYWIVDA